MGLLASYFAASLLGWPQKGTELTNAAGHHEPAEHAAAADEAPPDAAAKHEKHPPPYYMVAPFGLLLAAIAILPLIHATEHFWENNLNKFLVAGALALGGAAAPALVEPAAATPAEMQAAVASVVGGARVTPGKVKLDIPPLVENGNTVPCTVTVESPMTAADHVKAIHVFTEKNPQPYVIGAVLGNQVPFACQAIPPVTVHILAGRVRALAITADKRSGIVPDVPTMAELGFKGHEAYTITGMLVPAGTPPAITRKLNSEVTRIMALPDVRKRVTDLGADIVANSPQEFSAYIRSEIEKWGKVIKAANITAN